MVWLSLFFELKNVFLSKFVINFLEENKRKIPGKRVTTCILWTSYKISANLDNRGSCSKLFPEFLGSIAELDTWMQ